MTTPASTRVADGLPHPEGVAFDDAGFLYTGTAAPDHMGTGAIYRVDPEGGRVEQFADTGGRALGLAFTMESMLVVCDAGRHEVLLLTPNGGIADRIDTVEGRRLQIPNFAVVDGDGRLYVSDSGTAQAGERTAAIYRIDRDGTGVVLADGLVFANGLALDADEEALYVVETRDDRVLRIPLRGTDAGRPAVFATGLKAGPDGIAFDRLGNLLVTLTRTHAIVSVSTAGARTTLATSDDDLVAPSNLAFAPSGRPEVVVANVLGSHLTRLTVPQAGAPLAHQRLQGTAPATGAANDA